mgnify:CR=1 FL=1
MKGKHTNNQKKPWRKSTMEEEIVRLKEEEMELQKWANEKILKIKRLKKRKNGNHKKFMMEIKSDFLRNKRRHELLKSRRETLEWDSRNIIGTIEEDGKWCSSKKMNIIMYPKGSQHYAKIECCKCGRTQGYVPFPNSPGFEEFKKKYNKVLIQTSKYQTELLSEIDLA